MKHIEDYQQRGKAESGITIGIDPGVHTGFAIYERGTKRLTLRTLMIHQAFDLVRSLKPKIQEVVIENPNLWTHFSKADQKGAASRQQGAGSVKRDYKAWADFLTDEGIVFRPMRPDKHRNQLATDLKTFIGITGYREKCSEHSRVAAMLVWGN